MTDLQRIEELRRRVQRDPASLAFAQLAEECRRAGHLQEAVRVCRAGLAHHPDYLSARVTLGRALLALGQLDPAADELSAVLHAAPENLAALRGLAEVYHRKGRHDEARGYYEAAFVLAPHDLEISSALASLSPAAVTGAAASGSEAALSAPAPPTAGPAWSAGTVAAVALRASAATHLPEPPGGEAASTAKELPRRSETLRTLERWLSVLEARHAPPPPSGGA